MLSAKFKELLENIFSSSTSLIVVLIVLLIIFGVCYIRTRRNLQYANYFLDVIRSVSKALSQNHEIVAFNDEDDIIYTTHPQLYTNKEDFLRNLSSRITSSANFKNFCKFFDMKSACKTLLSGSGSGLHNQFKKWITTVVTLKSEDSLIDEGLSVVTLSDVSKQFEDSEKVNVNYERLENFLDHFPMGIFYVNNKGEILGANATFANLMNLDREKIIGMNVKDFIMDFDYNIPSQKQITVTVKPKFTRDFSAILVKSSTQALASMQPWIIYKNHVLPEQKISIDENFMSQKVFTSTPIPSIIANTKGEIVAINPAFASMIQDKIVLGQKKIMNPGAKIKNFLQKNTGDEFIANLHETYVSSEKPQPVELKFAGGITTMAYISKVDSPSMPGAELLMIQLVDITSQKILEQQFIQSQKMQAIGQLAGGIAHDFNNLLTAMIGFCDLLLQRYTQNDPSYGDVVQIKQNAGRAANLVRQLLAFSRQQTLKPKVVSITEILIDLSALLKRLVGVNIEYKMVHGRDIWPVKLDSNQFEQVIVNLVVNARDAMNGSGKLTIKTQNYFADKEFKCIYDIAHPGDYVLIEITDNGCGIDPANIEQIFEPFFSKKDEKIKKRSGAGTGLGLSTVYGIINQTGGFINVDSTVGVGSTFKIYIPRYDGPEKAKEVNKESELRDLSGNATILLVEDEEPVRMFSARALREKGYKVLEAPGGEEALKIAKDEKFDLLVTDVVMPKIDGPSLSAMLRQKMPKLKTIFISGYTEDTFRQDLGKNSEIHFLQKPFTLKDLAVKVKEVFSDDQ